MAIRELFATFTFDWDRSALPKIESAAKAAEAKVRALATATSTASSAARASTGMLAAWGKIARTCGVGAGEFKTALGTLRANLAGAAAGDQQLSAATKTLGLDLGRVTREGRSVAAVWSEVTGRLARVEDASERAHLALTLLGEAGSRVALPATAEGPTGLRTALRLARPAARTTGGSPVPVTVGATAVPALNSFQRAAQLASRAGALPLAAAIVRVGEALQRVQPRAAAVANMLGARMRAALSGTAGALHRVAAAWRAHTTQIDASGRKLTWWQRRAEAAKESARGGIVGGMLQAAFWTGLGYTILRTGQALGRFALQAAVTFGRRVFNLSSWSESLRVGLGMIDKLGKRAGALEFSRAADTARDLGLNVETAVDGYKKLRGVGFSAQKSLDLTKLVADLQAGLSLTDETTGRVLLALGQIKGAGVLQGDELRQLQETGISIDLVWQSIAKQMGVSVAQAKKLKEAGKVSADVAIKAVEDATLQSLGTSKLGEAAAALTKQTMSGRLRQAKASVTTWLIELGDTLKPKFDSLAQTIGATFERFAQDGTFQRVTDSIARVFGDLVDLIEIHWPRVERILRRGARGGELALGDLASSLDSLIDGFLTAVEWIQDNWPEIKETISDACTVAKYAIEALFAAKIIGGIASVVSAISSIGSAAKSAAALVRGLASAVAATGGAEATVGAAGGAGAAAKGGIGAAVAGGAKSVGGGIASTLLGAGAVGVTAAVAGGLMTRGDESADAVAGHRARGQAFLSQLRTEQNGTPISRAYTPQMTVPVIRGGARAVTITDNRTTTVNVPANASPGQTGRAVGGAVQTVQTADRKAIHAALVGAEHG